MPIFNRLKECRHDRRMTQREMAEFLEISASQYNRYERQQRQPTLELALHISKKLGSPVNDIFRLTDGSDNRVASE